METFYGREEKG